MRCESKEGHSKWSAVRRRGIRKQRAIVRDGKPVETELNLRAKRRDSVTGDLAGTCPVP